MSDSALAASGRMFIYIYIYIMAVTPAFFFSPKPLKSLSTPSKSISELMVLAWKPVAAIGTRVCFLFIGLGSDRYDV